MSLNQTAIQVELEFFAILKDLLSNSFSVSFDQPISIKELKHYLIKKFPQAEEVLKYSRFSTETTILNDEAIIDKNSKIYVLPPSSGG
jgi:molybdopterin converting factor small subunit